MRVLFVSDARSWKDFNSVIDIVQPSLVLFGGDLVSDGMLRYEPMLYSIPEFKSELISELVPFLEMRKDDILSSFRGRSYELVMNRLRDGDFNNIRGDGFVTDNIEMAVCTLFDMEDQNHSAFHRLFNSIHDKYLQSPQFRANKLSMHVEKFYEALEYAGKICDRVFVVKGDHDSEYEGDYDVKRINDIKNCREISGMIKRYNELSFLGLSYDQTHYIRNLREFVEKTQQRVDVILTHAEERRMSVVAKIEPLIIFRGHYRSGTYEVEGVPVVSAGFPSYVLAEFEGKRVASVQYQERRA